MEGKAAAGGELHAGMLHRRAAPVDPCWLPRVGVGRARQHRLPVGEGRGSVGGGRAPAPRSPWWTCQSPRCRSPPRAPPAARRSRLGRPRCAAGCTHRPRRGPARPPWVPAAAGRDRAWRAARQVGAVCDRAIVHSGVWLQPRQLRGSAAPSTLPACCQPALLAPGPARVAPLLFARFKRTSNRANLPPPRRPTPITSTNKRATVVAAPCRTLRLRSTVTSAPQPSMCASTAANSSPSSSSPRSVGP